MLVNQSCLTLCDPMDCSPPGSSVHGMLQAKILDWVAIPFSRVSSWPRDQTWVCHMQANSLLSESPWKPLLFQFSSVAQSCLTLCNPMNRSTPGLPVHHQLLESLRLMSIKLVMPSSHLIVWHPLLLLPSIFPRSGTFPMSWLFTSGD